LFSLVRHVARFVLGLFGFFVWKCADISPFLPKEKSAPNCKRMPGSRKKGALGAAQDDLLKPEATRGD
jgi:hypothetical protein